MGSKQQMRDVQQDLQTLRNDVGQLADTLSEALSAKGEEISDDVMRRMQKLRDDVDDVISQATSKGGELIEATQLKGLRETVESSVREHPLTMLAVAAGVGAAIASQLRR